MSNNGKMILSAALMHGLGNQRGAWRIRKGDPTDYLSPDFYADLARTAEAGKLHVLFLAETMTYQLTNGTAPSGAMDTVATLAYMAAVTSRIGLVGTSTTTYNQPYDLARRFATLDHLSRGRVGWNSVTGAESMTADMYGTVPHPPADERYRRADEFIDVVAALWNSWEADAMVGDKDAGIFADTDKVHEINHVGKYFAVRGPMPFMRSRQGRPVIFHAGSSPEGRAQASRVADVVFTAQHTIEGAREFRTDIRNRAAAWGRDPDLVKVLPGMHVIMGRTMDEAEDRKAASDEALPIEQKLRSMAQRTGFTVDFLRERLDEPFPVDELIPDADLKFGTGWRRSTVELAVKEQLTVRQLLSKAPSAHHHIVGNAAMVADAMEERLEAGAADGFTMMIDVLPEGMHDLVELLVPELQRRGLHQKEYGHATLRSALGIGEARPLPKVPGSFAAADLPHGPSPHRLS